jgi:putative lipoic acid-binding regulatory protein
VIASEKKALEQAIKDVIDEREHKLSDSNKSKTGKYVSMNLDMLVHNEDDRQFIYDALKKHQDIKMVL